MDRRHQNNQSRQQRRASIYSQRKRKPRKKRNSALETAKDVLRRAGHTVYNGEVEDKRFKGTVVVFPRRLKPAQVIEMAGVILAKEAARRIELLKEHKLKEK